MIESTVAALFSDTFGLIVGIPLLINLLTIPLTSKSRRPQGVLWESSRDDQLAIG
jgi:hypothetical protein